MLRPFPRRRSFSARLLAGCGVFAWGTARAVILYGGDNTANQSPPPESSPAFQVPWERAAGVTGGPGTNVGGTCVYVGNNFFLTAKHVGLPSHVRIGGTDLAVDTAWGARPIGTADAHVFRVHTSPALGLAQFYTGSNEAGKLAVVTGWGLGRDPATPAFSNTVPWGQGDTVALRWGTNQILGSGTLSSIPGESYEAFYWYLGIAAGPDEASLAGGDSGAPVWVKSGGVWKLAGIATGVKSPYVSTFQDESNPDANNHYNAAVRLSRYQAELAAAMAVRTLTAVSAQPAGGAVSPAGGTVWPLNYAVPLAATPQPGWRFTGWTGAGAVFGNASSPTTTVTLSGDLAVSAGFENLAADGDGDGIANLLAYAFALESLANQAAGLPQTYTQAGPDSAPRLALTYRARTGDAALGYAVEASTDLSAWNPAGPLLEAVSTVEVSPGVEERTVRTAAPVVAGTPVFLRVRVTYAE